MKNWDYIELEEGFSFILEENFVHIEVKVEGWSDNINFADIEELMTIRMTVNSETHIGDIYAMYHEEDAKDNLKVIRLFDVAVESLGAEATRFFENEYKEIHKLKSGDTGYIPFLDKNESIFADSLSLNQLKKILSDLKSSTSNTEIYNFLHEVLNDGD